MKIHHLRPDEFPKPIAWMTFFTLRSSDAPHFLGKPSLSDAKPRCAVDPLVRDIDAVQHPQ